MVFKKACARTLLATLLFIVKTCKQIPSVYRMNRLYSSIFMWGSDTVMRKEQTTATHNPMDESHIAMLRKAGQTQRSTHCVIPFLLQSRGDKTNLC